LSSATFSSPRKVSCGSVGRSFSRLLTISSSQQRGGEDSKSEEAEGGILLEKEDIQLIYKALRYYNPTEKEAHLHGILVEEFEELLATEYIELQLSEE
jgi:hypothetical protein